MGEVYRAHDTRLGRDVAIKVSKEPFSERFEREAHAVAALNHPHICQLYDVGPNYLVMEFVEGEPLKGPLPLDKAVEYAAQVLGALDAAHQKGITHRDLKPANILVTRQGIKLLDFGLAKQASVKETDATRALTDQGQIVGTLQYMSPEQLQGKEIDTRSDLFSFGCVLYELLTGKRAFDGSNKASVIAAILEREPAPLEVARPLDRIVRRSLAKEPDQRFQTARDLKAALAWALEQPSTPTLLVNGRSKRVWIAATAIVSLIAGVFAFAYFTRKTPDAAATRFSFAPPFKANVLDVAVSPDGRRIAFAAADGGSALWLRSVDSFNAEQLPGTDGAMRPFWSPDGRSLGFFSGFRLKRVEANNRQSPVQTLTSAAFPFGGAWSPEGLLYSPEATGTGLYRISADGGAPVPVTRLNSARQEIAHRYPQFLPDGHHFIFWVWSALEENTGIYAGSLDPKEKLPEGPLVPTWREARYVELGYLLFLQGSRLVAQKFDTARLRVTGEPLSLPELVGLSLVVTGRAMFSVSSAGVLAYQEAVPPSGSRIVWRDRAGKQLRSIEAPQGSLGNFFSLAPDEMRIAIAGEDENTLEDLWVVDLERATSLRLTAIHGSNHEPVWSPDGRRVAFSSNRNGVYDLYRKQANGIGEEELLLRSLHRKTATSWSPDGRFLVYMEIDPRTGFDILVLPFEGDRKPFPFLQTEFSELWGRLSPVPDNQGHLWMAYSSNETGRAEIYLRPFLPGTPDGPAGSKVLISTGGGFYPQWRKDGRELFYAADNKLMAVDVKLGGTAEIGPPKALFEANSVGSGFGLFGASDYAPFADGRRFLFVEPAGEPPAPKINVVLNWAAELKR
jgi:Tol biopolymer transport system component/predicted Ser/Thr protein kinase